MPPPLARRFAASFDRLQVARVRRAYTSASGWSSPREGLDGMLEEMRWGLEHLPEAQREEADRRALGAIFLGRPGVALIRAAAERWPEAVQALFARLSPAMLRFLAGEIQHRAPRGDRLERCEFRRLGGPALCEQVCRRPTERFCEELGVPVSLTPEEGSLACTWRWGGVPDVRWPRTPAAR